MNFVGWSVFILLMTSISSGLSSEPRWTYKSDPVAALPASRDAFLDVICSEVTFDERTGEKRRFGCVDESDVPGVSKKLLSSLLMTEFGRYHRPSVPPTGERDLPFWRFVPLFIGSMIPETGKNSLNTFATSCYGKVEVTLNPKLAYGKFANVTVVTSEQRGDASTCLERYWLTVAGESMKLDVEFSTTSTVFFNVSAWDTFTSYDYNRNGVRFYVHNGTGFEQFEDLLQTALLFLPQIERKPDIVSLQNNMLYLNQYSQIEPFTVLRPGGPTVMLKKSEINNGDLLFCSDMDGMGPTIAFPTGSTANHVAIFLRDPDFFDALYVCESANNGIACTLYEEWIETNRALGSAVVFMPLDKNLSASFDNNKAWNFVQNILGFRYGYNNFILGWIDTPEDNYPCMPSDWKRCLVWEHVEWLALTLGKLSPALFSEFAGQALNHRLNTTNQTIVELFMLADKKGIPRRMLPAMPELDKWNYTTTRNGKPAVGPSMVCSVLVCNALRAGGVFTSWTEDFQCAEQTPFDIASMMLFDESKWGTGRPAACQTADPSNDLCQLTGNFTFHLNYGRNTRVPYKNMSQNCTSQNPLYKRGGPGC